MLCSKSVVLSFAIVTNLISFIESYDYSRDWSIEFYAWPYKFYYRTSIRTSSIRLSAPNAQQNSFDQDYFCIDVPSDWIGETRAIDANGNCVRLYSKPKCTGLSRNYHKNPPNPPESLYHPDIWGSIDDTPIKSISPCFHKPEKCSTNGRRNKRSSNNNNNNNNTCPLEPPLDQILHVIRIGPTNPFSLRNPVSTIGEWSRRAEFERGYNGRIEYLGAVILSSDLDRGTTTNLAMRSYVRSIGRESDVAGHIIAKRLGGSGTEPWNIFPQNPRVNSGRWRTMESNIYDWVRNRGPVRYMFSFLYPNSTSTRPLGFIYRVEILFNDNIQEFFQGYMYNP